MSQPLQTVDRALQVLQAFRRPDDELTVTELAARLGIHRSSASRLVSTLGARGFVERTAVGDLVRLGPEIARLGRITLAGRELAAAAQPLLERLAADTGETVTLAAPAGAQAVTVAQADGGHFVTSGKWVGQRTPVHCTADGKVLLAYDAVTPVRGALERRTPRTVVDRAVLARQLRAVRTDGYAVSDSEFEHGLVGVAVPVRDGAACIAAVCVSGPEYRLDVGAATGLAGRCGDAARALERALGI